MIRYELVCAAGHRFDGWFANSAAFDAQEKADAVACPVCGSSDVGKAVMAPSVSSGRRAAEPVRLAANVPEESEAVAMLRKLRKHLTENADYVGNKFAEEARRIHYNEAERRGIYGEATPDDARALADEGIEFHPLPRLPEDHN
jgi:hypothetical protein